MKVLVIGGSGFLGQKLINRLSGQEIDLYAAVRSTLTVNSQGCNYISVDELTSGSLLGSLYFDVVINVAMKRSSRSFPISDDVLRQLNYEIPIEIVRNYSNENTLVINTSTYIQNYNGIKGKTVEGYGANKELLSRALNEDADSGKYRALDFYLFTLYGPDDHETHLVPLLLSAISDQTSVSLSEGNQLMNLLYVDDALASIIGAINIHTVGYSAYHLWEPEYFSVRDLVLSIEQFIGAHLNVNWGVVPYRGHEMFKPWDVPIKKYPNFFASTSLADGIKVTYKSINK